ncbi:MAG TPA: hypothetical protein VK149_00155 [Sideroxyarcus sp.]|nr:hypothetical protein [Sideroxyarcus sp.]
MKMKLLVLALCGSFATAAHAEGLGVYINGGTSGFGLGLAGGSGSLSGRLVYDTWKKTFTQTDAKGNYNIDLKLQTVSALADWYPFDGAFRTTFGLVANGNKATLAATAVGGSYTFNGQTYAASDVGSYTGEMKFNSTAPYLGIGWGNPVAKDKTWGFVTDIGVLFQGSPKVTSTVTCGAAIAGTAACTTLQNDVAAGATQLETDLKNYKYYPVISIGLSYRF